MSLIEVVIASGLTSIVSLAVWQVYANQSEGERRLWQAKNVFDLSQMANLILKNEFRCRMTLGGAVLPVGWPIDTSTSNNTYTELDSLQEENGTPMLSKDGVFPAGSSTTRGAGLINIKIYLFKPENITISSGAAETPVRLAVRVAYNKLVKNGLSPVEFRDFPVMIYPDTTGTKVNRCLGSSSAIGQVAANAFNNLGTGVYDSDKEMINKLALAAGAPGSDTLCLPGGCRTDFNQGFQCTVPGQGVVGFTADGGPICGGP